MEENFPNLYVALRILLTLPVSSSIRREKLLKAENHKKLSTVIYDSREIGRPSNDFY
nr:unnamed protein product [Callosobruchus chinensis]